MCCCVSALITGGGGKEIERGAKKDGLRGFMGHVEGRHYEGPDPPKKSC